MFDALSKIFLSEIRHGSFAGEAMVSLPLPRIEVAGVGVLGFPLQPEQARRLVATAEQSPFGKGALTLVDTEVRRSWQIGPERFTVGGVGGPGLLSRVTSFVKERLGVVGAVHAEVYKLLIYEPGGFFTSHRDTEKVPGMFATAVVVLPSAHQGGEIEVRHLGHTETLRLGADDPGVLGVGAFYADCVHEVRPVTGGYRVALLLNMFRKEGVLAAPDVRGSVAEMAALMRRWEADAPGDLFLHLLEHQYTSAELSFDHLKGRDTARVAALVAAGKEADMVVALGLLDVRESGAAELVGGGRRWEEPLFVAGEVYDSVRRVTDLKLPDGAEPGWDIVDLDDDGVFPAGALDELEDDVEFNEYTGNEGASYERQYQRAVVACWPRDRSLALMLRNPGTGLASWLFRWMKTEDPTGISLPAFAAALIRRWPIPQGRWIGAEAKGDLTLLLQALSVLEDGDLVLDAIDRIGVFMPLQIEVADAWVSALRVLGPDAEASLVRILRARVGTEPGGCAALARAWGGQAALLPLVEAVEAGMDLDAAGLSQIALAFADQPAVLGRMADALAPRLDVDRVLLPALVQLAGHTRLNVPLRPVVQRAREVLQERVDAAPRRPTDFVRSSASITCRCADCAAVKAFLASPTQEEWRLSAVQAQRARVWAHVAGADLTHTTLKRGSPHTLVLTKNLKSYEEAVALHQKQVDALQGLACWG